MRTAAFLAISTPLLMVPLMFHAPLGPALSCRVFGALAASGTVAMQVAVERRIHNGMPPAEALSFFTALQMGAMLPAGALLASSVQLVVRKVTTTLGKFAAGSIKSGNLLLELRIAVDCRCRRWIPCLHFAGRGADRHTCWGNFVRATEGHIEHVFVVGGPSSGGGDAS